MKVLHACLCGPFTDGLAYQENELVEEHVRLGHEVTVVSATDTYDEQRAIVHVPPGTSTLACGATLIRLPYRRLGSLWLRSKLRAHVDLAEALRTVAPERILFHGLCAWDLLTVARHVRDNAGVVLHADSHEDFNNSARTRLARWGLHHGFYRPILRRSLPQIAGLLCVSIETMDFVEEVYGIDRSRLEYFPLGGKTWSDTDYADTRRRVRGEMGWAPDQKVLLQSGKIDSAKRLDWTLDALAQTPDRSLRLVVAGQLMADVAGKLGGGLDADPRVRRLGWVSPERLRDLLCAADVYVQPGSQSATMQMALCCRRPVVVDDVPSHRALVGDNGILVRGAGDLTAALARIGFMTTAELDRMSSHSSEVALRLLDYRQQALRVLQPQ